MRRQGSDFSEPAHNFALYFSPHPFVPLVVKSRFVRDVRHKTRLARSRRCEDYGYHIRLQFLRPAAF